MWLGPAFPSKGTDKQNLCSSDNLWPNIIF
jgi:hypothetical protein